MKSNFFVSFIIIIITVGIPVVFGNCSNNSGGDENPSPGVSPLHASTPDPSSHSTQTPDISRKLEVAATVVGGAVVNDTNEIWILVSSAGDANVNERITTNGGTVLISGLGASVSVIAVFDPGGSYDPGVSSSFPRGSMVEIYNDVTMMELSCTTGAELISIGEGTTESVSIVLEERNLIDAALETAGTYTIEVYADNYNPPGDSRLSLYDDELQLLRYNDDTDPELDDYFSKISYNLTSGKFYVKVYGGCSYDNFGYTMTYYNDGSRPGAAGNNGDGSSADAGEPGNDYYNTTGDTLILDTPLYRNIESGGDEDWFVIVIP